MIPPRVLDRVLLGLSVLTGAVTHAFNLFKYPLYITDEGIYIQQAWYVLREARLSPYTYDLYKLDQTDMQVQQLQWVRKNIPPDAKLIIDDNVWADLHDTKPYYKWAHSHFKAASDPDVRDKLFGKDWRNIDYIVVSNKMRDAMLLNNTDGGETWILQALDHSKQVWSVEGGDVNLEIVQVIK